MLTIKQGKDLSPVINDLECGECFLCDGKHFRKISEDANGFWCYNFTDNRMERLNSGVRVRRMTLVLSEEGASEKTIFFVGCRDHTDGKFVVDYCTFDQEEACEYCNKQSQRKNTWSVYEAEIGTEFENWDEIHVAPRGTD